MTETDTSAQLAIAQKNLLHLKAKIIETNKLVELYQKSTAEKQKLDEDYRMLKSRYVQTEDQLKAAQSALREAQEAKLAQESYVKQLDAQMELYQSNEVSKEQERKLADAVQKIRSLEDQLQTRDKELSELRAGVPVTASTPCSCDGTALYINKVSRGLPAEDSAAVRVLAARCHRAHVCNAIVAAIVDTATSPHEPGPLAIRYSRIIIKLPRIIINNLLEKMEETILFQSLSQNVLHALGYCYAATARAMKKLQRTRVLISDLMMKSGLQVCFLHAVLTSYPAVLVGNPRCLIRETIRCGLSLIALDDKRSKDEVSHAEALLRKLGQKEISRETLANSLIEQYRESREGEPRQLVGRAILHLAASSEWFWTYNSLMLERLWPLLPEPSLQPGVLLLLGDIGRIGMEVATHHQSTVGEIRARLEKMLAASQLPVYSQLCCAISLIKLAKGNLVVMYPAHNWYKHLSAKDRMSIPMNDRERFDMIAHEIMLVRAKRARLYDEMRSAEVEDGFAKRVKEAL